jgi:short-subunit dehydrogenase
MFCGSHDVTALITETVVIVGASSGIGLAVARSAASHGAKVIMLSRSLAKREEAANTLQGTAHAIAVDMARDRRRVSGDSSPLTQGQSPAAHATGREVG